MTTIYLVRHGATDWNINKRAQGTADVPLNHEGRLQALHASEELSRVHVDAVYTSDLSRAYDTAVAIAKTHGLDLIIEPRFREIDQGEWTGLTVDEIRKRWPEKWGPARHYNARPGGESPQQVRARALAALTDVVAKHPDEHVVIVSHGGTIRWMSAEALGYDDFRSSRIRGVGNGEVVCLDAVLNDGHLKLSNFHRWDGHTADLDDPND
ncbi:MAG TPA: histidine phosphatase family protein [Actinomycetota bacterium]|nr:histidine phosphatase family protein [Actinomycetota bacterium]